MIEGRRVARGSGQSEMKQMLRGLLALALMSAGTSCEAIKAQRAKEAADQRVRSIFVREEAAEPLLVSRVFYGSQPAVRAMIEIQDDTAYSFRGLHAVGDGSISVGIKDGRGRWLPTHECGGHLFVEAAEGQPCQIVVKNSSRTRLEIVAGMDGADAVNGGRFDLNNHGIVVGPLQTVVIGKVVRGKPATLVFGAGRDVARGPVVQTHVAPSPGSIIVCGFKSNASPPREESVTRPPSPAQSR